jgi:hypothetical protein
MRSISSAILVLAGAELIRTNGDVFVLAGMVIGIIGMAGWIASLFYPGEVRK